MKEMNIINNVNIRGTIIKTFEFEYRDRVDEYYKATIAVNRLSNTSDLIDIVLPKRYIDEIADYTGLYCIITNGVYKTRKYYDKNKKTHSCSFVIPNKSEFEIEIREKVDEDVDLNDIVINGTIAYAPYLRKTPKGKTICECCIIVPRSRGDNTDYFPCISWQDLAFEFADFDKDKNISIKGRIQSRKFTKNTENGPVNKMVSEISIVELI